jgi:DNA-binding cell septation regulator SpoVG
MPINLDEISVKIKFVEEKQLKAILSLEFDDYVVKGFRIQTSKYQNSNGQNLWLTPPSYKASGGKYHPIFFMTNKKLWKKLEEKVWIEYYKQLEQHYQKRIGSNDTNDTINEDKAIENAVKSF